MPTPVLPALISLAILTTPLTAMAQEEDEPESTEIGISNEAESEPTADSGWQVLSGGEVELTFPRDGDTREISTYIEAEIQGFYFGFSALASNDRSANELALYLGYRGELESGFNYDLSYTRFTYPNDGGDCCGEFMASLGQPISDKFGVAGEVKLDPNSATRSAALGLEYYVTDALSLTANYGVFREDSANHNEWDFGVIYGINDRADVDLRYYDSSDEAGYLGITLSIDTTLLGG